MVPRRRFEDDDPKSTNNWMITYTDLCTLLLTFFVLLISMSAIDQRRQRKALNSLDGVIGFSSLGQSIIGIDDGNETREYSYAAEEKNPVDYDALKDSTLKRDVPKEMEIFKKKGKTYIEISQAALFKPGSFKITPKLESYLGLLAEHLKKGRAEVEIRGHTDMYEGVNFPYWARGSWGLSAKRATAVYNFLRDHGVQPERMSAHGFSFYRPLADSIEYPELRKRNERVEIIIGSNESLPTSLSEKKSQISPYVNYKNFFFRLFPTDEGNQSNIGNPD